MYIFINIYFVHGVFGYINLPALQELRKTTGTASQIPMPNTTHAAESACVFRRKGAAEGLLFRCDGLNGAHENVCDDGLSGHVPRNFERGDSDGSFFFRWLAAVLSLQASCRPVGTCSGLKKAPFVGSKVQRRALTLKIPHGKAGVFFRGE